MTKCKSCNMKVNKLMLIPCGNCNKKFCISCRTPEVHGCEISKEYLIARDTPIQHARFEKLQKI